MRHACMGWGGTLAGALEEESLPRGPTLRATVAADVMKTGQPASTTYRPLPFAFPPPSLTIASNAAAGNGITESRLCRTSRIS